MPTKTTKTKETDKAIAPTTPSVPEEQSTTDVVGYTPTIVKDPAKAFDGYDVQTCVWFSEDGECMTGNLLDKGTPVEMNDGQEVNTWIINVGNMTLRLGGGAILDRELGALIRTYEPPIPVKILRTGTKDLGGGRSCTLFAIGMKKGGAKRRDKPLPADVF